MIFIIPIFTKNKPKIDRLNFEDANLGEWLPSNTKKACFITKVCGFYEQFIYQTVHQMNYPIY